MLRTQYTAIVRETIREARSKKTLIGFMIVSTIIILVAFIIFRTTSFAQILNDPSRSHFKGESAIAGIAGPTVLDFVWTLISSVLLFITISVGVFATANFITSMLEKGIVDLYFSKPVPKWLYILGRFSGAVIIMFFEVIYLVVGLWLVVGITTNIWGARFLLSIFFNVIGFMGFYSIVVLLCVITRSSMLAVIGSFIIYIITALLLPVASFIDKLINGEGTKGTIYYLAEGLRYLIPPVNDIGKNMANFVYGADYSFTPLILTLLLTFVYLGLSSYIFSKKEY